MKGGTVMPSNPSRQRIIWVDVGKYFCIMFVMLSHLESNTELLSKFYSPFFLTTFFFLSGYVYMRPLSFRNHIIKKIRGLLIPWLIFSVMDILLSSVISLRNNVDVKSELFWNFLQIRGMGDAIWFVAALFVAYIPFYFLIRIKSPLLVFSISAVCSVISVLYSRYAPAFAYGTNALPWHLEYIFQAILWMVLGYYFRSYWEPAFDKCKTVRRNIIIWALYIIVAYIPTIRGGSIIVPYLRSIIGILAVICLSKWVHTNWYVRFVGQNTLIYFAWKSVCCYSVLFE